MAETEDSNVLQSEAIYLILLALFAAGVIYYLYDQSNSAYVWEDFYAKQTASFLNSAKDKTEIKFDIQPAFKIAKRNGLDISSPENIIDINANDNTICVKLSKGKATCYSYFNEVAVSDKKTEVTTEGLLFSFIVQEKTGEPNE